MKLMVMIAAVFFSVPVFGTPDGVAVVIVGPGVLRSLAESVVLPSYPVSSYKATRTGVAVIEVAVSPAGKIANTKVLETPDRAIGDSVETAVKQWTFHPLLMAGKPVIARSRLIFYFRIEGGKPVVVDATKEKSAPGSTAKPSNA
jgi:TonB family protein